MCFSGVQSSEVSMVKSMKAQISYVIVEVCCSWLLLCVLLAINGRESVMFDVRVLLTFIFVSIEI